MAFIQPRLGGRVLFSCSELGQSLVETGTGLSREARYFHRPYPIDKCLKYRP